MDKATYNSTRSPRIYECKTGSTKTYKYNSLSASFLPLTKTLPSSIAFFNIDINVNLPTNYGILIYGLIWSVPCLYNCTKSPILDVEYDLEWLESSARYHALPRPCHQSNLMNNTLSAYSSYSNARSPSAKQYQYHQYLLMESCTRSFEKKAKGVR